MVLLEWVTDERLVLLHALGACRGTDPNVFHPKKGESAATAKRICATCPVRVSCREYGLVTFQQQGVWGGLTEKERSRERARRGIKWVAA